MGDFFYGWRRKIGCVTLVMACVFMSGWVSSIRASHAIAYSVTDTSLTQLTSRDATLTFRWILSEFPVRGFYGNNDKLLLVTPPNVHGVLSVPIDEPTLTIVGNEFHWILLAGRLKIGNVVAKVFPLRIFVCIVPYWLIAIPLTFVSAYLLLVKPRIAKARVVVENVNRG